MSIRTCANLSLGRSCLCRRQTGNTKDPYAVAVLQGNTIVSHVPHKMSAGCSLFIKKGVSIEIIKYKRN